MYMVATKIGSSKNWAMAENLICEPENTCNNHHTVDGSEIRLSPVELGS